MHDLLNGVTLLGAVQGAVLAAVLAQELMAALAGPARHQRGVLELALEAWFNSKSTLNSSFNRYTDLTPSEFRLQRSPGETAEISRG